MTAQPRLSQKHSETLAPVRVMLVDDSKVARSIFARILNGSGKAQIVAEAETVAEALAHLAKLECDIILLDVEMPGQTGLDGLPDIIEAGREARVIMLSSLVVENAPATLQALARGACDTLAKPGRSGFGGRFAEMLIEKVVRIGERKPPAAVVRLENDRKFPLDKPACIAIGASTGGIPAIHMLIRNLNPALDCPIFITQHLPENFIDHFARQLSSFTDRPVSVAARGIEVLPGRIYVAPGDAHLICRRLQKRVIIDHVIGAVSTPYCPSVDVLFTSVARVFGAGAMGLLLSGMGNDGVAGARLIKAAGGRLLAQDERSSVVWGMPRAAVRENLTDAILNPEAMVRLLDRIASQ